jgi:hypothetical protein
MLTTQGSSGSRCQLACSYIQTKQADPGIKAAKGHITLLFCCDAAGD